MVFDLQGPLDHTVDKLTNPDRIVVDLNGASLDTHAAWRQQLNAMAGSEDATPPDPQEARQELRRLLTLLMIDRLKQLETEALTQASTGQDPEAQQRWRSLHERRKALMAAAAALQAAS